MDTETREYPRSPNIRRRWLFLLAASLSAIGAALAVWLLFFRNAAPLPPAIPSIENDPEVMALLEQKRRHVRETPRSASTWGALGEAFMANEMENESLLCFAEAERLDVREARWPYFQGAILAGRGEQQAALSFLHRAVELCVETEADIDAPRLLLADTLLTLGQLDEAEEHFRRVLESKPDDVRAHLGAARIARARRDWNAARTHLLRCLASPLARKKASRLLAVVCLRLGDETAAEQYGAQADRLPDDGDWIDSYRLEIFPLAVKKKDRYRMAEELAAAGRLPQAAKVLQSLVQDYPDDYLPHLGLGKTLGQLHDNTRAEVELREALRLAPDKIHGRHYLALVLFGQGERAASQGKHERAADLYRQALEQESQVLAVKPDYGLALMTRGLSLKGLGKNEAALEALRKAVRCNPEYAELHFCLAEMLAESGRRDEARGQVQQALQMAPPDASWRKAALRLQEK